MQRLLCATVLMATLVLHGAGHALSPAAPGLPSLNVAWLPAATDADVDRAFAQARSERKPLLLYWGAAWCPPCNQLKATLFNRQDFAALSRSFVAVHVDGDRPGAQVLGRRFKVSGYPTVVIFNDQGAEVTRLPGEVDAPQMMAVLQLGLAGGRPVKTVLTDALAGKKLPATEWRLLAFYSWETDEQQLVPKVERASTLQRLAMNSAALKSDTEVSTRLWLKAAAASDDAQGIKADAALRDRVQAVLADPVQARQHMDVLSNDAVRITRTLQPQAGPARAALVQRFEQSLVRLQADPTLSRGDRQAALLARVELARLQVEAESETAAPQLPASLLDEARALAARDDREITDGYERQAVITSAAYLLGRAGLWADSESLLKTNLAKSHSPYYLMSQLAGNARKQGRTAEALSWSRQAFEKSVGPATRLQWGLSYLNALVDLAPKNSAVIEKTASQLLTEAAADSSAFAARSGRSLQRASVKLVAWAEQASGDTAAADKAPAASVQRLRSQAQALCPKVDLQAGQRAACEALFKAEKPT